MKNLLIIIIISVTAINTEAQAIGHHQVKVFFDSFNSCLCALVQLNYPTQEWHNTKVVLGCIIIDVECSNYVPLANYQQGSILESPNLHKRN